MSTVSNGVIASLSVSQISKFNEAEYGGCPRRWWLTKLGGEVEPVTKAMTAGVAWHAQDEHYLKTGEDVLGIHAMAGKHLMPLPGSDLFVEWGLNNLPKPKGKHYFPAEQSLLFAAKVPLIGFIDLLHVRGTYMDGQGGLVRDPSNTGEVWDHKSGLQELMQRRRRATPTYRILDLAGPAHERQFIAEVLVKGVVYGSGEGRSKKDAEQAAAAAALAGVDRSGRRKRSSRPIEPSTP